MTMTTTTLHADVQRSRFAHHTFAALAGLLPGALRRQFGALQTGAAPSASVAASIEAQRVRDLARGYAKTDPGFASDLYAAAARHEGLHAD
jgi:hypothetical protein